MFYFFTDENLTWRDGTSATISMMTWFLLHLLSLICLIPIVGPIIWLVVYIMIGLRADTAPSIRNYIKLQLMIAIIGFVIGIIVLFACASLFTSIAASFV